MLGLDIGVQRLISSRCLAHNHLLPRQSGVDGAVQDDASDVVGEEFGVGCAQFGAVGVTEVVEVLVSYQCPHDIHVTGDGTGVRMIEDLGGLRMLLAGRGLA